MAFKDHFRGVARQYAQSRPTYPAELFEWLASQCAARDEAAAPHPRIRYRVAAAEASGLASGSADLVVVTQALHWFDLVHFYDEVRRVLKRGSVIAVWCYGEQELEGEEVNRLVARFYREVVGPYWPPERRHVETGYRDLPFPFARIEAPHFAMRAAWDLGQLLGYLRSWSATARFTAARGFDPVSELEASLAGAWGEALDTRVVTWPLGLLVGRNV